MRTISVFCVRALEAACIFLQNKNGVHNLSSKLAGCSTQRSPRRCEWRCTAYAGAKGRLQLPLSLAFTRFMNLFSAWIPAPAGLAARIAVLAAGIILTGIGAAMSLDMRLIPNPGDGIVQALADCFKKPVGLTKNLFDLFCIGVTAAISLIFARRLIGIGFGTVAAMLGVGRVIALFSRLFLERMATAAGIKNAAA